MERDGFGAARVPSILNLSTKKYRSLHSFGTIFIIKVKFVIHLN